MALSSTAAIPLTFHEALSGILGSISIACWIFLLIPQLLENFRNASASAISLPFLLIWFLGDICNLAGAAWAGLVPTVIAIAVYFCVADGVLIGQVGYYNWVNRPSREDSGSAAVGQGKDGGDHGAANGNGNAMLAGVVDVVGEEEPLLSHQRSGSLTIPGSGRRRRTSSSSSAAARRRSSAQGNNVLARILEENDEQGRRDRGKVWMKNIISIVGIMVLGAVGWAIAWGSGAWRPTPVASGAGTDDGDTGPVGAQILGYASAIAYLGARIPQIVKNAREKSCEGLSLLFFILSLMGNLTYGAGIIFHSLDRDYIITNVPWLIGSLGTMVEDVVIFVQFHIYAKEGDRDGEGEGGEVAVV